MAIDVRRPPKRSSTPCTTENFIYCHHTGKFFTIPVDPDGINDQMGASFIDNFPLSRSAPIYSYQHSGPRSVTVSFDLHRDLFQEFNPGEEDAVDELITNLDSLVLPDYESASKMVNPPMVSLKLRDEIYIKGVVTSSVGLTYNVPILQYGEKSKYAMVSISFGISEITPYSASILPKVGGKYRG